MHKIYYDKEKTLPVTDYEVCRHAIPIIRTGIWYVYGKTRVWARDDASVWAYENSLVNAHDNSKVYAYGNSWVWAAGNSRVLAHNNSNVHAHDNSTVVANGNSWVVAYDNSWVCRGVEWPMTIFQNSKIIDRRDKNEKRK